MLRCMRSKTRKEWRVQGRQKSPADKFVWSTVQWRLLPIMKALKQFQMNFSLLLFLSLSLMLFVSLLVNGLCQFDPEIVKKVFQRYKFNWHLYWLLQFCVCYYTPFFLSFRIQLKQSRDHHWCEMPSSVPCSHSRDRKQRTSLPNNNTWQTTPSISAEDAATV